MTDPAPQLVRAGDRPLRDLRPGRPVPAHAERGGPAGPGRRRGGLPLRRGAAARAPRAAACTGAWSRAGGGMVAESAGVRTAVQGDGVRLITAIRRPWRCVVATRASALR